MAPGDRIEICEDSEGNSSAASDGCEEVEYDTPTVKIENVKSKSKTVSFDAVTNRREQRKKKTRKLTRKEQSLKHAEKRDRDVMGLVKPDILKDKERERFLRRIATQGVVQLFNAVAQRQKQLNDALDKKVKDKKVLSGANFSVSHNDSMKEELRNDGSEVVKRETVEFD